MFSPASSVLYPACQAPQLDTLWAHFAATPARYQDISPSYR
ncbi:hypothetical protein RQP54_06300 [Curvibacter sp. APW13]|nr:hypothetical protein [Curvibacter sp. APW13]MDT8990475.1 hypothetical protein [Curvibacter sp. APW13]